MKRAQPTGDSWRPGFARMNDMTLVSSWPPQPDPLGHGLRRSGGPAPQGALRLTVARGVSTATATAARTIELPPDLIVHEPEPLRQELLDALASGGRVALDASEVHRVGVVALQLLLAFVREARQSGVGVEIFGVRKELVEALRCTGLDRDPDLARALSSSRQA
ncbi:MAG: STAS domain-containing protein [Myxococcales bacterium]|nr:MAG: STAS domain-containing protein [Myxococcales bacterium]